MGTLELFDIAKILFIIGAISGVVLYTSKNSGKLMTGIFALAGSIIALYRGFQILLKAGSNPHVDVLSAFFVILICLISTTATIYGFGYLEEYRGKKNLNILGTLYNIFILAMLYVVLARDAYSFIVAWETMSVVSFFLVLTDYKKEYVRKAGFIYLVMTHVGTAFIIFGFLVMSSLFGNTAFSDFNLAQNLPPSIKSMLFFVFLIGFGTKAGIMPLHVWLPRAHPVAPSHISALMSAVMIKMAVYGLIRVIFSFLGPENLVWGEILLGLGVVSAVLGVLNALMQQDIKRLLAYSSVENMGIIFMALGLSIIFYGNGQQTLGGWALLTALAHTLNHAVFKALLFMGAGAIHNSTRTKNMELLGGLIKTMPITALLFFIGTLSISALPPLNGFVSEWLLYQGFFTADIVLPVMWSKLVVAIAAAALALTGALAVYGFVKAFGVTFLALPRSEAAQKAHDAQPAMLFSMAILAFLCIFLGVFSSQIIHVLAQVVNGLTEIKLVTKTSAPYALYDKHIFSNLMPGLLFMLLVFGFLIYIVFRLFSNYKAVRRSETWTCGIVPTARMEYTGASFTQPLRIVFSNILFPERKLSQQGKAAYFLDSMKYDTSVKAVIEDYFYKPLNKFMIVISKKIKPIQSGQIQFYIMYIFLALIILLLWML